MPDKARRIAPEDWWRGCYVGKVDVDVVIFLAKYARLAGETLQQQTEGGEGSPSALPRSEQCMQDVKVAIQETIDL